jgi:hypothetical protein
MAIEKKNREIYNGKVIKQVKGIIKVFDTFFENEKFNNIIEIGSGSGIFSIYFALKSIKMNTKFITVDIKKIPIKTRRKLLSLNVDIINCDINKDKKTKEIIHNGRCLILNDGALKIPVFFKFASLMKKGDVLLTHDYYANEEFSGCGGIALNDVRECIKCNNLEVVEHKDFNDMLWLYVSKNH